MGSTEQAKKALKCNDTPRHRILCAKLTDGHLKFYEYSKFDFLIFFDSPSGLELLVNDDRIFIFG